MYADSIVTSILMALFISIICAQPIMWLQKKKVPQVVAIAIVFIGIIGVIFGFGQLINVKAMWLLLNGLGTVEKKTAMCGFLKSIGNG